MIDPNILTVPARRIQTVLTGGIVLLFAITVALAFGVVTRPESLGESLADMSGFSTGPMQAWQNSALAGVAAIHLAVWIMVLGTARRVFGALAKGEPETAGLAARTLSYWLWAMLAWGLVSQMLVAPIATWGFPEGEHIVGVGVGTSQISLALSALIAGFMARAFALGAQLWRDHQEVV
ncbi:MAG: hypothetical protein ROR55_29205 [Devosia sp.]